MKRSNEARILARLKAVDGRRQEEIDRLLAWCAAAETAAKSGGHVLTWLRRGTGKELVARATRALIAENCGIFHGLWLAIECLSYERVSASTLRKLAARVYRETQTIFGGGL